MSTVTPKSQADAAKQRVYLSRRYVTQTPPRPSGLQTPAAGQQQVVEKLVDRWEKKGKIKYKVRWQGFPPSADTWETREHLWASAREAIVQFEAAAKDAEPRVAELALSPVSTAPASSDTSAAAPCSSPASFAAARLAALDSSLTHPLGQPLLACADATSEPTDAARRAALQDDGCAAVQAAVGSLMLASSTEPAPVAEPNTVERTPSSGTGPEPTPAIDTDASARTDEHTDARMDASTPPSELPLLSPVASAAGDVTAPTPPQPMPSIYAPLALATSSPSAKRLVGWDDAFLINIAERVRGRKQRCLLSYWDGGGRLLREVSAELSREQKRAGLHTEQALLEMETDPPPAGTAKIVFGSTQCFCAFREAGAAMPSCLQQTLNWLRVEPCRATLPVVLVFVKPYWRNLDSFYRRDGQKAASWEEALREYLAEMAGEHASLITLARVHKSRIRRM
eukprot:TRINITY_DN12058_c0_g1_i1.p1 TRINITY_DN12058_c0_g1~~TRINITY_DN12058_c0_g1_i1.p1  ORF type:complete len:454 (+),score=86.53 TRINITY_DN12058_c0_g1_i1:551-1912(+)